MNYLVDTNIFDAYQFAVALENKLAIATQDKDFQRVRNLVDVRLL
jgi:predicted nucleic acid-binding protein